MYTVYQCHSTQKYNPEFPNVGKLSVCANSGYQALFSDFSNQPRKEAIGRYAHTQQSMTTKEDPGHVNATTEYIHTT